MRLAELVSPDFRLHAPSGTVDLAGLIARGRALAPAIAALGGPGGVIAVPAADPAELLAMIDAVWSCGAAALPLIAAKAPYRMDLPATPAALVIRTSGSTGAFKYPAFDGAAVARSAATIAGYLELDRRDCVGLVQPLEHSFGLVGQLLAAAHAGSRAMWSASPFPDERVDALVDAGATVVSAVPFLLGQLLELGLERAPLRAIGSAGGPLPARLAAQLTAALPGAVVWNQYGCTEAGPRLTACPSTHPAFARGSVGPAIAGVTVQVSPADGRIGFTSPMAMREYLGDPAATAAARADGGFYTGDIGRIDHDGHLYVAARTDEIVKLRGHKVSLSAVAAAAERAGADVAVALVVRGAADRDLDGVLCLVYEGARELAISTLAAHLPLSSVPARLVRVRALPRLVSGKIDRARVAELAGDAAPSAQEAA